MGKVRAGVHSFAIPINGERVKFYSSELNGLKPIGEIDCYFSSAVRYIENGILFCAGGYNDQPKKFWDLVGIIQGVRYFYENAELKKNENKR